MSGLLRRGAAAAGRRALASAAQWRGASVAAARSAPTPPLPPLAAALRARCGAHGAGCRCGLRGFASGGATEPKAEDKGAEGAASEPQPGEEGAPSVEELLAQLAEKENALEEHAKQARAPAPPSPSSHGRRTRRATVCPRHVAAAAPMSPRAAATRVGRGIEPLACCGARIGGAVLRRSHAHGN